MFYNKKSEARQVKKKKRQEDYERVFLLHEQAEFLCYINEAYMEEYEGRNAVKLEGLVAMGTGRVTDTYQLFDCKGRFKAEVKMEELYRGTASVELLEGGDKRVALYPMEQEVSYRAGDILCKLKEEGLCHQLATTGHQR